jgi:hypothetical protein
LSGSFVVDPGATMKLAADGERCVGDEDPLIRAAGGITGAPTSLTSFSSLQHGVTPEAVVLAHDLVAVWRRASDEGCAGGNGSVTRAMYRDLLGRPADAAGARYWVAQLDGGTARATVASRLQATDEARANLVRQTWATWSCDGLLPSDDEVAAGVAHLRSGGALADLRAAVLTSTVPDGGDPVDCLYHAVLGRVPDAGGRAYAESRLTQESLARLARRYMVTSEGRRVQFNRLYQKLLGRDATADEITAGTTMVRRGIPESAVMAQVAGSDEFATRAAG